MKRPSTVPPVKRFGYSPAETAGALGICRSTVYNLIAKGDIKVAKIGTRTIVPVSEIERLAGMGSGDEA